eukprot:GHUV01014327.1.p1 GENE.GHUV01014327.1~~GHUV01014327.1.p1  ORF type:complete len:420 (+),score=55.95 GHUV01014327.1:250-1509(+)
MNRTALFSALAVAVGACVQWAKQRLRPRGKATVADTDHEDAATHSATAPNSFVSVPKSLATNAADQASSNCASHDVKCAQKAVEQLRSKYAAMAADFESKGLDVQAIAETAVWFEIGPVAPWPRRYASFVPKPLPSGAVRLVVLPVSVCNPQIANLAARVAGDVLACLPSGYKVFSNARQNFHITVFHFSHPADPRPDALDPHSGLGQLLLQDSPDCQARIEDEGDLGKLGKLADLSAGVTKQASTTACPPRVAATCSSIEPVLPVPYNRPGPTQQQIQAEQRAMASVTSNTTPFTLQVDRVLLAPSGVLLLTWVDPSGSLGRLRQSLHEAFPGACSRQSSIIHTSLFRIVDVPTTVTEGSVSLESQNAVACLDQSTINNIQATCSKWTSRVSETPHNALQPGYNMHCYCCRSSLRGPC